MTPQPEPIQPWTEEELDALSEITEEDIDRAMTQWEHDAPRKYRQLLNAKAEDDATAAA